MVSEIPIVRVFAACEELEYDATGATDDVTLRKLFHRIRRLPGEAFPCYRDMALYAIMTNGRGKHRFGIALFFLNEGVETNIAGPEDREIDLGRDPTIVFGLPIPRVKAIFAIPGQYTFALLCDNDRIAEYHIEVR